MLFLWFACKTPVTPNPLPEVEVDADTDADSDADSDAASGADSDAASSPGIDTGFAAMADSAGALFPAGTVGSGSAAVFPLPTPSAPACGAPAGSSLFFPDVTSCAGLSGALHARIPPSMGVFYVTGQGWGDFDRDGWLDLVVTGGALPSHLYRGGPDGLFMEDTPPDLAALPTAYPVSVGDADGDGWPDLFVGGRNADYLLSNAGGALTLDTVLPGLGATHGGAWSDLDGDGLLEIYASNYYCVECFPSGSGTHGSYSRDQFFRRLPWGDWEDQTAAVFPVTEALEGMGFTATWADFDDDADLDLMVVNDKGSVSPYDPAWVMNRNIFWRNDGPGCAGTCFEEISLLNGSDLRIDSMGLAVGDYDNDGDLDASVTDGGPIHLLQNQGDGTFVNVATAAGLSAPAFTWGVVWLDYDNDGWLDLFTASSSADALWHNNGNGTFTDVSGAAGLADTRRTYGVAAADYDADGRVDLALGDTGWAYRLHRNVVSNAHHWLGLRLFGSGPGGTTALGARVWVTDTSGRTQLRELHSGSSNGAGDDLGLHFGLGTETPTEVRVVWPDGVEQVITPALDRWSQVLR